MIEQNIRIPSAKVFEASGDRRCYRLRCKREQVQEELFGGEMEQAGS